MEVFNATNRPNFTIGRDDTATQLGTAGFGVLGQALASRQIQLGLKFYSDPPPSIPNHCRGGTSSA